MPAGKTYTPLARTTLSSAAATVTFSNISGSYTDLVLVSNVNTSDNGGYYIQFNSDTGTNYSRTFIKGNGSSATSGAGTSTSTAYTSADGANQTNIHQIFNYSNTTTYKTLISRVGSGGDSTLAFVVLWRSTAAISSILLSGGGSRTFSSGSTFTLYGILAA